ncbi:hypothetical protein BCR42DRAFT_435098 [Absidia repens]|uniref:BAR domain-domain-containing protein n=1 Tax=Absidia repens TaxID=90262 RepID=A0A1X2IR29_9FUNG|nr:hypothetical protein BCR42DRAFT_435098 [Absidia repens]
MTKAISRLPHQLSSNSKNNATKDSVYDTLQQQFETKVKQVEQLMAAVTTFRDETCSLLNYQQMPSWLEVIDPVNNSDVPEESSRAYQDYAMAMEYCSQEVTQSVDYLDGAVLQPLNTYIAMTKTIQKSIIKRQHKQLDYDRFRLSHQKLSNMADKSPSEEKNVYKLESQLDTATKDYFYMNDLLKSELEQFLLLTSQLIPPLFDTFYNIQCQVYGGLYARIYEIVTSHSGLAFKTMDQSIEQGYQALVTQRDASQEMEQLCIFQKENVYKHSAGKLSLQDRASLASSPVSPQPSFIQQQQQERPNSTASSVYQPSPPPMKQFQLPNPTPPIMHHHQPTAPPPPPPQQQQQQIAIQATQTSRRRAPPPPPPKPKALTKKVDYAQALYDFEAQQEGDLPLRQGDKIEILEKTQDAVDWWKGRIGNQIGIFPGNYVQLI